MDFLLKSDPAIRSYFVHSAVLALKVLIMALLTGRVRHTKFVFPNEEDAVKMKGIVKYDDPDVERVRRAHLNDLENVTVFWIIGGLYLTTGPSGELASFLFRVYTVARVIHTVVYVVKPMPQPTRGIAYGVAYIIKWYMGIRVLGCYISAL